MNVVEMPGRLARLMATIIMHPLLHRLLKLIAPFVIGGAYMAFLYFFLPQNDFWKMSGFMLAYLIPPAGKESVIPLAIASGLPWWLVATSISFMDFEAGLFMAWNFDIALRIPLLGSWIEKFIEKGKDLLEAKPWIEKLSFIGLVLFVMFPLQGSGGIGGSLVGRMLGMDKYTVLLAITLGALIGCFSIAIGVNFLKIILEENFVMGMAIIVVAAVIVALYVIYKRNMEKAGGGN